MPFRPCALIAQITEGSGGVTLPGAVEFFQHVLGSRASGIDDVVQTREVHTLVVAGRVVDGAAL